MDAIRKDQAAASTTLYQQRSAQPQRKRVRRERTRLQQQLQQLCKDMPMGRATCNSNFCDNIKIYFSSIA